MGIVVEDRKIGQSSRLWQPEDPICTKLNNVEMTERNKIFTVDRVIGGAVALITAGLVANMLWTREPENTQLPYLQDEQHYWMELTRPYA